MNERSDLVVAVEKLRHETAKLTEQLQRIQGNAETRSAAESARAHMANLREVLKLLRSEVAVAEIKIAARRPLFADDHACKPLRGRRVPTMGEARKTLVKMAKFLDERIRLRAAAGHPTAMEEQELAAIVMLAERVERADTAPARTVGAAQ